MLAIQLGSPGLIGINYTSCELFIFCWPLYNIKRGLSINRNNHREQARQSQARILVKDWSNRVGLLGLIGYTKVLNCLSTAQTFHRDTAMPTNDAPDIISNQTKLADERLTRFYKTYRNVIKTDPRDYQTDLLAFIEMFVTDCLASNEPGYTFMRPAPTRITYIAKSLGIAYFDQLNRYLDTYTPKYIYSPKIELFFQACRDLGLIDQHRFNAPMAMNRYGEMDAETFNRLIEQIRKSGRTPKYKARIAKDNYRSTRRFINLVRYVDALFEHVRSQLLVIRVDLSYCEEEIKAMNPGQAQEDLKHFFDNMKSKPMLFGDLVGYIWKLERSSTGGDHFHFLFFFTNDHIASDERYGREIGEYWVDTITKGRGRYFNCNTKHEKSKHRWPAIGTVKYYEDQKRYSLLFVLAYFCKEEQSLRIKTKKKTRAFGRGVMPSPRENVGGRPRSIEIDHGSYLRLIDCNLDKAMRRPPKAAQLIEQTLPVSWIQGF